MKTPFLIAAALFFAAPVSAASFESGETPAHFLEVYVSQGCADCPPAEKWLSGLKADERLWKSILPVAWHVDYWDRRGWRDALGSRNNSIRQKSTASETHATVYTPGFFLNGKEWRGFFDANPLPPADAPPVGRLRATKVAPAEFVVEFYPVAPDAGALDIGGALLGMDIEVPITSGENRGLNLLHDFAVLGSSVRKASFTGGRYSARIKLTNETEFAPRELAAVFWVTPQGRYNTIQAVGGPLTVRER